MKSDVGSGELDGNGEMEARSTWASPSFFWCREPVQYKLRRHRFYHLRTSGQLYVYYPPVLEAHPGCTDILLDLWDRTSVYAGCFFVFYLYLATREFCPKRVG